ncbi:hypothetical protein BRC93_08415 [Halobacteriales archaeon QS_5_70_15]|nr:MAG: hypothetical protein BRC93_08415 [Halobacteriales archaeon QS_5_70_15]
MIHKRILEAAESEPSASMEELAAGIGGASTEPVERVLDEYGDPAGTESEQDDAHTRTDREDLAEQGGREGVDPHGEANEPGDADDGDGPGDADDGDGPGDADDGDGPAVPDGVDVETLETDESEEVTSMHEDGTNRNTGTKGNGRNDGEYADLSDGQLRALRLIERNPEAPQSEIAAEFDVTRATVSRWLNDIPGFEWSRRGGIATRILNGDANGEASDPTVLDGSRGDEADAEGRDAGRSEGPEPSAGRASDRLEELDRRLERIEGRLDRLETEGRTEPSAGTEPGAGGVPPELAHRVVHACMNSDRISEAEELRLLRELMG